MKKQKRFGQGGFSSRLIECQIPLELPIPRDWEDEPENSPFINPFTEQIKKRRKNSELPWWKRQELPDAAWCPPPLPNFQYQPIIRL